MWLSWRVFPCPGWRQLPSWVASLQLHGNTAFFCWCLHGYVHLLNVCLLFLLPWLLITGSEEMGSLKAAPSWTVWPPGKLDISFYSCFICEMWPRKSHLDLNRHYWCSMITGWVSYRLKCYLLFTPCLKDLKEMLKALKGEGWVEGEVVESSSMSCCCSWS